MEITLIFPNQLYAEHPALTPKCPVLLYEDPLFFGQMKFHKQKLMLHRASMKSYANLLEEKGYKVDYVEYFPTQGLQDILNLVVKKGVQSLHVCDPVDYLLERRLKRFSSRLELNLVYHKSPGFLLTREEFQKASGRKQKYHMANFYILQRKKFGILLEPDESPVGGKWSFDTENRKKLPKGMTLPNVYSPEENAFTREARLYVESNFADHYGDTSDFHYPVNHAEATKVLDDFLENRLEFFGDYEDAITSKDTILFHSLLTPGLNTGLLTPAQVLDRTFEKHRQKKYPMNSLEGFIRQIIGWREFMKGVYELESTSLRQSNYFKLTRPLPKAFWTGETGIPPIDNTIQKVLKSGYCHHIERLMVLGNFMHLCGFAPDDIYRWFMEMFIDSYDWVMVPNVYGMSQYATAGLMTTKPYVSGSNYILKMSDYKKGEWCDTWDALYWRYLFINREELEPNPRMKMMYMLLNKMPSGKLEQHLANAEKYLAKL